MTITIIWILKNNIFPEIIYFKITILETYLSEFEIQSLIPASIAGLIARLGLEGIIESLFEDLKIKQPLNQSEDKKWILTKDNEGGPSQKKGGVIGPEDYTYDSDTESEPRHSTDSDNKASGDSVETFEEKVGNMTSKEDVTVVKQEMQNALELYKSSGSNVPAFKEQVSNLEKKIEVCDSKLSELETKEQTEGKGKEKETTRPPRVINPNYRSAPISSEAVGSSISQKDYFFDSDEEEKAIRRAIEESLKTESSKGESSRGEDSQSSKGKGKDE